MTGSPSTFPNGSKMPPTLKWVLAILAAIIPAWYGAARGFSPDTTTADSAQVSATRANEKADLAFELLKQKAEFEHAAVTRRVDTNEKRLDRMEQKIDRLLSRGDPRHASTLEPEAETHEVPEPRGLVEPVAVALPSSLDAALRRRKAERVSARAEL